MKRLNFYLRLLGICTIILSEFAFALDNPINVQHAAEEGIISLYKKIGKQATLSDRLAYWSAQWLDRPYLLSPLGEGLHGEFDQGPLYRVDGFDCETFVETVMALALGHDLSSFTVFLRHIRYRDGHISFIGRNHFTCPDWNRNNLQQGIIQDITSTILDHNGQPIFKLAHTLIDRSAWIKHVASARIRLLDNSVKNNQRHLHALLVASKKLTQEMASIPYLPFNVLFDQSGRPQMALFTQIPQGAIIEIVRPNWDLTDKIGTHLNVSHMGFAFWQGEQLIFREASSRVMKIRDIPLIDYLQQARKDPTIQGVNLQQLRAV